MYVIIKNSVRNLGDIYTNSIMIYGINSIICLNIMQKFWLLMLIVLY